MYESRGSPLLSRAAYARRVVRHLGLALLIAGSSLLVGVLGFRVFEGTPWPDAFLHSAMLLGGIGLVEIPRSAGGRIFAGAYALYAGAVFLAVTGIVFAPLVHRLLHRFHWDDDEAERHERAAGSQRSS